MLPALIEAVGRWDFATFQWLRTHHWPLVDPMMAAFSDLARGGALWIGLALLVASMNRSRWPAFVQVLLAVILTGLVVDFAAKPFFNRSRPFESYVDTRVYGYRPTTRSLPSGHAAQAMAGAYALTRLAPDARAIFWTLGFLVAFSRIYLGVHYPADVVVGGILGLAMAKLVVGRTRWSWSTADG